MAMLDAWPLLLLFLGGIWLFSIPLRYMFGPKIPGVFPWPLVGNLPWVWNAYKNGHQHELLSRAVNEMGNGVWFQMFRFSSRVVILVDPKDIQSVIVSSNPPKSDMYKMFERVTGQGLFTNENPHDHAIQRKRLQPAFLDRSIRSLYPSFMDILHSGSLLHLHNANGQVIDVNHLLQCVTLDMIGMVAFDEDFHLSSYPFPDRQHAVPEAINYILEEVVKGFRMPWKMYLSPNAETQRRLDVLDGFVRDVLHRRRSTTPSRPGMVLVDVLIESGLSDDRIRDELMVTLVAGSDTTAHTVTWALYALSQHPDAENSVMEELHRVVGDRLPNAEDISKLKVLSAFVKETLRCFPPAPIGTVRKLHKDMVIRGERLPAGTSVMCFSYGAHKSPLNWSHPETFDHTRMLGPEGRNPAYLPFSAGKRSCIGMPLALFESKLILAVWLGKYRFTLQPDTVVTPKLSITLKPKGGLFMSIHKR